MNAAVMPLDADNHPEKDTDRSSGADAALDVMQPRTAGADGPDATAALARSPLTLADVRAARPLAQADGVPLLDALASRHSLRAQDAARDVAALVGWPCADTARLDACQPMFDRLPIAQAMQRRCVLVRDGEQVLAVVSDPFDEDLKTWLRWRTDPAPRPCLAPEAEIRAYLAKQEAQIRAVDAIAAESQDGAAVASDTEVLSLAMLGESSSPAVKLVNSTLYDALRAMASDVHLESTPAGMSIRYRIDGVLDHATSISGRELAAQAISRIKVLAELDISERRIPQDGSFRVEAQGREIDLRVSVMPSVHGEDAVIRILDKQTMVQAHGALSLKALGFDDGALAALRRLVDEPYGMLLVTGPTGSGKTTTLYAALGEVHDGRDKIITIEDPVEYQLPGVLQIPVNEKKGLTFARGLRSILRHDPDKIMVGEIRDRETAEIAVQSALTGHLVLSTVHANNVFDVFGRFSHMGIDPYAFVSALNGIWAQRLVRNVCPACAREAAPAPALAHRLGLDPAELADGRWREGGGCGECRGTGYKGRTAIAEILALNDEIRELIIERASARRIKEAAARHGTRTLRDVALELARQGWTTLEEVKRVTLQS